MDPPKPVENETALIRCEVKFRGKQKDQILKEDLPYLRLFHADYPTQNMITADMTGSEENALIKVRDISIILMVPLFTMAISTPLQYTSMIIIKLQLSQFCIGIPGGH